MKILLSVASGLARITSRTSAGINDMTQQLTKRLTALGRAHNLVRPLPGNQGSAAFLGDIFSVLLAVYDDQGAFAGRIRISVPRMGVGQSAAASLALIVYELATNSLKYGSLSVEEGVLDVSGSLTDDTVHIIWSEQGEPEIEPAGTQGYGSRLVRQALEGPLGGLIRHERAKSGAMVVIEVDADRLAI